MPSNLSILSFAENRVRFYRLARLALQEALRAAGTQPGDKVLVPAFICREALPAIHAQGAEPVFYPVERSLAPQFLPQLPRVRAVLAVNYFGFPQDLDIFRDYCSNHEAALIEDNAHGYLSCDPNGNLLGTRGDFGIVSLRKTFALPDGGALLDNRLDRTEPLAAPLACRDEPLPTTFMVKRILGRIQAASGLRVRTFGEDVLRGYRQLRTGEAIPVAAPESEFEMPGTPAIHCESLRMLRKVDPAAEVRRRRGLFGEFQERLSGVGIEPLFGALPPGVAPYGYPFRGTEAAAAEVARIARQRGLNSGYWPDLPASVSTAAPDYYRNVWWVNFLC